MEILLILWTFKLVWKARHIAIRYFKMENQETFCSRESPKGGYDSPETEVEAGEKQPEGNC